MKKKYLGLKQQFLLLSLCSGSLIASPCQSAPTIPGFIGNTADVLPPIPVTALPTGGDMIQGIDSIRELSPSQMEITQNAPKAVIHWQTFNIGSKASVNFSQKDENGKAQSGWAALNAIGDASPSQIHGSLTADGSVYLINRNGIFFGPSAQVNVHSLTASALNLKEENFINGYTDAAAQTLTFGDKDTAAIGSVENSGTITAADGGQVFLIGGKAVNNGSITAKNGMVAMAAGDEVTLTQNSDIKRYTLPNVTTVGESAEVINRPATATEPSLLQADEGVVGLYGGIVNQDGRVIATSAISRNGQIELKALSKVSTGAGSITATPVTASTERQTPSKNFTAGLITVQSKEFQHQGTISTPGGKVIIKDSLERNAEDTGLIKMEDLRLEAGSVIDVSGTWVDQTIEDRILDVQLNSDVLKDAYALKNGPLQGEKVLIDILNGMPAADISAYLMNRPRSAAEQLTTGGTVELDADRIETRAGSRIDFSGGGYHYAGGDLDLTVIRVGSRILSLSDLPAGTPVDELMGIFTRHHERYGIRQTWKGLYYGAIIPIDTEAQPFTQGSNAGTLLLTTPYLFMAGELDGWAERGIYQSEEKEKTYSNGNILAIGRRMPKGGTLEIGANLEISSTEEALANEVTTNAISIVSKASESPADTEGETSESLISAEIINNAGLSALELHAATTLKVAEDAAVRLAPGGRLNASARQILVDGSIQAAGGNIFLTVKSNKNSFSTERAVQKNEDGQDVVVFVDNEDWLDLEENLTLSKTGVLDVAGEKISNTIQQPIRYGYTKGGTISLINQSSPSAPPDILNPNHGYDLTVTEGSRLSVQGGYWQGLDGSTKGADSGSLTIRQKISETSLEDLPENLHLTVDGDLEGHALLGKNGGILTIAAHEMAIYPAAGSPPSFEKKIDPLEPEDDVVIVEKPEEDVVIVEKPDEDVLQGTEEDIVTLDPEEDVPQDPEEIDPQDTIVFADNRFARTGFSSISFETYGDLLVTADSSVTPSSVRRMEPEANPMGFAQPQALSAALPEFIDALPLEAGTTKIALKAGYVEGKNLTIEEGAVIAVEPEGKIDLAATGLITLGGTLDARAGAIDVKGGEVLVEKSAALLAQGINLAKLKRVGPRAEINWKVLNGGSVTIESALGSLAFKDGATIDVSGSPVVVNTIDGDAVSTSGDSLGGFFHRSEAGSPGSITFTFWGNDAEDEATKGQGFTLEGTLLADAFLPELPGGTLTIKRSHTSLPLSITEALIEASQVEGFDDLRYASVTGIDFSNAKSLPPEEELPETEVLDNPAGTSVTTAAADSPEINTDDQTAIPAEAELSGPIIMSAKRRLVLDAPQIIGSNGEVILSAPWVQLVNTQYTYTGSDLAFDIDSERSLTVNAGILDVSGNIRVNGFSDMALTADEAIRLSDRFYKGATKWSGSLTVNGNLSLQAKVVYPTTGSIFTLKATEQIEKIEKVTISDPMDGFAPEEGVEPEVITTTIVEYVPVENSGNISILPQEDPYTSSIYSAGGSLAITGANIFHGGYLAAPMGTITMTADKGALLLEPESRVSVSGTENVVYGSILNGEWKIPDKKGTNDAATTAMTLPTPSISLSAHDVLIAKGSRIDADGGGSLTAHEFLPGLDGTANPLRSKNRLIIVPDSSLTLPELGQIYLEGNSDLGLAPGTYSILPEEFAFVPGAFILERGTSGIIPGQDGVNLLHQPIIAGYERPFGSDSQPLSMTGYVLRTAADILKEGKFDRRVESVNDGGNISISSKFSTNDQKIRKSDDTLLLLGDISASGVNGGENGGLTIAGSSIHYAPVPEDLQKISMQEKGLLNLRQLVEQERTIVLLEEGLEKIQAIPPANLVKKDKKTILADLEEDLQKLQSMPPEELAKEGRKALLTQLEDDLIGLRQLIEQERAITLLEKGRNRIDAINLEDEEQLSGDDKKNILADLKEGSLELQNMTLGELTGENKDSIVAQVQSGILELQAVMKAEDFTEEKKELILAQLSGGLQELQTKTTDELEKNQTTLLSHLEESLSELHTQTEIIPGGLIGNVYFDNTLLQKNGGLSRLTLGDYNPEATAGSSRTETISFAPDQTISGIPLVELKAEKSIEVAENTLIEALATDRSEGKISLTTAQLTSHPGSLFHAANELAFHVSDGWDFQGAWQVDDGRIIFDSNLITLGSTPDPNTNNGMFISNDMLATLTDIKEIEIESATDIRFLDDVTLTTSGSLLLDSQRLLFKGIEAPEEPVAEEDSEVTGDVAEPSVTSYQVSISADTMRLRNSHGASAAAVPAETLGGHSLEFNARELTLGPGAVRVDGFTDVALKPQGNLFFEGQGSFEAMLPESGTLSLIAAGFFAAFPEDEETLGANRFLVSSGNGEALFQSSGEADPDSPGVPGNLTVTGRSITMDGALLDFPGGRIELAATGTEESDGVVLKNGTQILARGGILQHSLDLGDETATVDFHLPGGEVLISAASGLVEFSSSDGGKNTIDVSADDDENGGRIIIKAPNSTLDLEGLSLFGGGGEGGSFELITKTLPELGDLADVLTTGGFNNEVQIQVREGDINLAEDKTLEARSITLAADGTDDPDTKGNITIAGTIKASGETGGDIAVYANRDLTLENSGVIEAKGTAGSGGKVILGSEKGMVITEADSTIDTMGGGADTENDGSVTFRVDLTETLVDGTPTYDVLLDAKGNIDSGQKVIQAVKTYSYEDGTSITNTKIGNIGLPDLSTNAATTWIGASYRFIDGLADYKDAGYTLLPEIEVRSDGSLTLTSGFQSGTGASLKDLSRWRPDGLPGVLSFRAAGDLIVKTNITDVPTPLNTATVKFRDIYNDGLTRDPGSWGLNFVAGADLNAANPLSTRTAKDLTMGVGNTVVYSESGNINLVAGQDIIISPASSTKRDYMPGVPYYTVASFDGNMHIKTGRDLNLTGGGVLQNAVGNIVVESSRDVLLEEKGAIRTTGRMATWDETDPKLIEYIANKDIEINKKVLETYRSQRFWEYRDGGDVSLRVGGTVTGTVDTGTDLNASTGWEGAYKDFPNNFEKISSLDGKITIAYDYHWSANYGSLSAYSMSSTSTTPTHGIATMGGGNITIETDGDFLAQTGAFGRNNEASLSILSRGDLDGRFLAMKGPSRLSTLGSFGTTTIGPLKEDIATGIGIGDTPLTVQALGSVAIGTIYNPTLANYFSEEPRTGLQSGLTYTAESGVHISAFKGSALLSGSSNYDNFSNRYTVLPGTLTINAARDISFTSEFLMAPAPEGGLVLLAGQDINGRYAGFEGQIDSSSSLLMSDADMSNYDIRTDDTSAIIFSLTNDHSNPPLHQDDASPVHVEARHDIAKINITVPKQAQIIAGNDLLNITYSGQNLRSDDESIIAAGHDINQQEVVGIYKPGSTENAFQGITQAGPGFLLVQAGNNLDLADSSGIQSIGSTLNPALQDPDIPLDDNGRIKGSDLTVIVGYDIRPSSAETIDFLAKLKTEVRNVSALIADGKDSEAAALKEKIRADLFTPFLYDHRSGTGALNMTTSSIQAISGKEAINIFAAGDVNVGVTTIAAADSTKIIGDKETGIFTAGGGPVNLVAEGDVNVNESRVMTFLGGDIVVLSDKGDVNAGRGSKAKVTAAEPQVVEKDGIKSVIFSPPAVGSGLRTLAYDPDGNGPRITPEPGDMYVVAWDGIVDAGEAGIEGGKLYLAANQVLNAQNISVGAGSVGVPAASGPVASLGALTGDSMSSTASTTSDIAKNTGGADDKMADTAKKIADTISQLRFFVVKFLGFIE